MTHAIGKSRAMEIVLTGKNFSAQEAADWGLISRVVEGESSAVVDEAVKTAGKIARFGRVAVQAGKEGVNAGEEVRFTKPQTMMTTEFGSVSSLRAQPSRGLAP